MQLSLCSIFLISLNPELRTHERFQHMRQCLPLWGTLCKFETVCKTLQSPTLWTATRKTFDVKEIYKTFKCVFKTHLSYPLMTLSRFTCHLSAGWGGGGNFEIQNYKKIFLISGLSSMTNKKIVNCDMVFEITLNPWRYSKKPRVSEILAGWHCVVRLQGEVLEFLKLIIYLSTTCKLKWNCVSNRALHDSQIWEQQISQLITRI